ncbi:hypothetical protein QCA50_013687 [Cerrena zonata]|uniref:Ubiquitin-like domain-containing protein n=1 Tax=Cerrena zonata TaxID=2478898 RepID=A0AAW0FVV4_9APHY
MSEEPSASTPAAPAGNTSSNLVVRPDTTTSSDATPHHDQQAAASPQTQGSATIPSDPPASDVTPLVVTSPPTPSEVVPTAVIDTDGLGSQHLLDQSVLSLRPGDFSVMSPSARTSHTRVDLSANPGESVNDDVEVEDETGPDAEPTQVEEPAIPQVSLTFLLVSGKRKTMSFDHETTIGRVKELAWNGWPNEWQDERPPGPSYIRILYLGKVLQGEDTLSKIGFPTYIPSSEQSATPQTSTIVHLSVRAYAPAGEDDAPKKKGRRRRTRSDGEGHMDEESEDDEAGCSGCGCVIC